MSEPVVLLIVGVLTLLGTYLGVRQNGRKTRIDTAQNMIDQAQEERADAVTRADKRVGDVEKRLEKAEGRVERLEARERDLLQYVSELRWHIDSGAKPPPPPFPPGLIPGH